MSTSKDVVVEAFARHRVVLAEDDPIITLGTILELAIDRGSEIQASRIEEANKEMVALLTDVKQSVSESLSVMEDASAVVSKSVETQEKDKAAMRKEFADELRLAAKHFSKEVKLGVAKVMGDEFNAANYRIDEHVKRALSAGGGDHRWKDRFVGLLAGWCLALSGWIGYMYLVKR